jgi:hypothetical protein
MSRQAMSSLPSWAAVVATTERNAYSAAAHARRIPGQTASPLIHASGRATGVGPNYLCYSSLLFSMLECHSCTYVIRCSLCCCLAFAEFAIDDLLWWRQNG